MSNNLFLIKYSNQFQIYYFCLFKEIYTKKFKINNKSYVCINSLITFLYKSCFKRFSIKIHNFCLNSFIKIQNKKNKVEEDKSKK